MFKTMKVTLVFTLFCLSFFSAAQDTLAALTQSITLKNANGYNQQYITGGQPTIADLEKLAKADVKIVINLRGKGEFSAFNEQDVVERLGMTYISLPVVSAEDLSAENVKKFHQLLKNNDSRTLVHCASGNRVGAFFALDAFLFGHKTKIEALEIGSKTGLTRLEGQVIKIIESN